jgi:membrane AbrB-like protein
VHDIILRTILALLGGWIGGAIFSMLSLPLPWMLGSLTVAAMLSLVGVRWTLPKIFRNLARPIVGVVAGSAFTWPVVLSMLEQWTVLPFLLLFTTIVTLLGWLYFKRVCRLDDMTSIFASTPGGLSELTLLGDQYGANLRVLVLVHSARVIAVVIAVPFIVQLIADPTGEPAGTFAIATRPGWLAPGDVALLTLSGVLGYLVGRNFDRMGGVLIASLVFSALVHGSGLTEAAPPQWVVVFIQVIIGSITGSRLAGVTAREIGSTVLQGVGWAGIMLATALLFATLAAAFVDAPIAALVLAFAPGGFPEMTVLAYTIGIEVAFVVTCHAIRIVCVFLLATSLASLLGKPPDPAA